MSILKTAWRLVLFEMADQPGLRRSRSTNMLIRGYFRLKD